MKNTVNVSVSMPIDMLNKIDNLVKEGQRSDYIVHCLDKHIK